MKIIKPNTEELLKYNVLYEKDSVFASNARLLQSKWRINKGYPEGKLGNYLELEFAKKTRANFLSPAIADLVTERIRTIKKDGGLIGEPRIWDNLLSSQPLCFNLFGELSLDLDFATRFFTKLFPTKIEKITAIHFEYSAGRGNKAYTGDHSAFDVFVEYTNKNKKGFIGIEVKFAETMREETKEKAALNFLKHGDTYANFLSKSVFKENTINQLSQSPIAQIWRDHLLSIAHLKDYEEGFFVFLFPKANQECQQAVNLYSQYLVSENESETGFYSRYIDDFIMELVDTQYSTVANELRDRYLLV